MNEWQPTNELRWLDIRGPMTVGQKLQQRWRYLYATGNDHYYKYEWRDVPTTQES